jgi:4-hydroxybenzoate polyprenyltransferase
MEGVSTGAPTRTVVPLLRAAHIGPALAVTAITALLTVGQQLSAGNALIVTGAVLTGQLTIGWGNDLLDAARDRSVGRTDKPLATGELSRRLVVGALGTAAVACVLLSFAVGWRAALVNLVLHVGGGHAYNLFFKHTVWSWLPYAVAFGTLPAVVTLAADPPRWPPGWMLAAAAALGVAAHFLNVLPDLEDDAATGVRGLPHRLGPLASRSAATALLVVASAAAVLGPPGPPAGWAWAALGLTLLLAMAALVARGKAPFRAAIAIALVDVLLLTLAGT